MFIAFALRTEPEIEFERLLFFATESECKTTVERLCEQFADDLAVELDWVGFPDETLPTAEQVSDPSYIQAIQTRIIQAFSDAETSTDEPSELQPEVNIVDVPFVTSKAAVLRLIELQHLERANLITQEDSRQRFQEILNPGAKREERP